MAETKCKETVVIYFDETVRKEDAVRLTKEMRLDPSRVVYHKIGDRNIYGVEMDCVPGFSKGYRKAYVNDRANENKAEIRGQRCDVPGKRKCIKKCPEENSCEGCRYRDYKPTTISIEHSLETRGHDEFGSLDEMSVQEKNEFRESVEEAFKRKPEEVRAFVMDSYGYSNSEIQEKLKISERTVRRHIKAAAALIREIWLES
ncbi:MAG: hypothetical protein IJH62_03205 [Mogibacterium sp.]|nr:hypothetical protein [Mogibacterium sp.]